jgi:hypothetical protein
MKKVFFVPGNTCALDYACEREDGVCVSYFTGKTLAELQEQYPGAIMGTEAEFTEQMEAACRTEPEPISAEQYADALDTLPPQDWQGIGTTVESFKLLERYAGRITSIYARVGCSYYRFHDICTLGHADTIQKVQAVTADN